MKPKVGDFVQIVGGEKVEVIEVTVWNIGVSCSGDYAFETDWIKVRNIDGIMRWVGIRNIIVQEKK